MDRYSRDRDQQIVDWLNLHAGEKDSPPLDDYRVLGRHMDLSGIDALAIMMRSFGSHKRDTSVYIDTACREARGYRFGYVMWPRKWRKRKPRPDFYIAFTAEGYGVEDVTEVGVWLAESIREEYEDRLSKIPGRIVRIEVPPEQQNLSGVADLLIDPEFHWVDGRWEP